jgi:hypothetical protein
MKTCRKCGEVKETTQFSKRTQSKDGLQGNCKQCNSKDNKKFREEINPEHHSEWQRINKARHFEILKKYRKADKGGQIYAIINPENEMYIGMTECKLSYRLLEHRNHYKRALRGKRERLPGLHDSFDKHGIKNHQFKTLVQLGDIDRKLLQMIEKSFITAVMETGKSLNTHNW